MKVYELRNNLKAALDKAIRGEKVLIERGGVQYELRAVGTIGKVFESAPTDYTRNVPVKPKKDVSTLLNEIPGVIRATDSVVELVRCKGTHYMDRTNCGKPGCPWSFAK